jgi:hypothetical protein
MDTYGHLHDIPELTSETEEEADHESDNESESKENVTEDVGGTDATAESAATKKQAKEAAYWESSIGSNVSVIMLVTLLFIFQKRYKLQHTAMRKLFQIVQFTMNVAGSKVKFPSYTKSQNKFKPPDKCSAQKVHVCESCEWVYEEDVSPQCPRANCQAPRYKQVNGNKQACKITFMWDIIEQLKMRLNWRGFSHKLELNIPSNACPNLAPNVVSSRLIPQAIRTRINVNVATELGAYVFILALACDGFQVWTGVNYTIWFLALRILNLKNQHAASTDDLITIGIIPGPREPKTLQFYANRIVQQLLQFQANQVTVPRRVLDKVWNIPVYAYLVALIGDYPGLTKLLNVQGVGNLPFTRLTVIQPSEPPLQTILFIPKTFILTCEFNAFDWQQDHGFNFDWL